MKAKALKTFHRNARRIEKGDILDLTQAELITLGNQGLIKPVHKRKKLTTKEEKKFD